MIGRMWRMLRDCLGGRHAGSDVSCEDVRTDIYALLAGDLDPAQARHVETHLRMCRHCFSRLEYARMMRRLTKEQVTAERPSPELTGRIARIGLEP